jgi:hypothetical protein
MKKEEMIATEPLMLKIQELRLTSGREVIGIQLVRLFIERRVHPISASACCLSDYSGQRDSTQISGDDLKDQEVNEKI